MRLGDVALTGDAQRVSQMAIHTLGDVLAGGEA
jgi:hypothetical protein